MVNRTHELIREMNLFKYARVIFYFGNPFNRNKLARVIIVHSEDQSKPYSSAS